MLSDEQTLVSTGQAYSHALTKILADIAALAPDTDREGLFPEQAFQLLARAGLLAVTLPGQPLDAHLTSTPALLTLLKQLGGANLAVGRVYEGHVNALLLAQTFGTDRQCDHWFGHVADQHALFSVWNTQAHDGVKIHALSNGTYELEGAKTFCSGADWIDRPLITGELLANGKPGGWQMAILPAGALKQATVEGQFWQPLGMRASASFRIDFTGITLQPDDLLGQPGDYFRQPFFSGGAIRFAAVQLGGAEALLDATRQLLRETGRTHDSHQQVRLAEMAVLVETGNLWLKQAGLNTDAWLNECAATTDPAQQADRIVAYANMTRTVIETICLDVMRLAERSVGARGFLRPMPFERIHRDLTMYLRQPAPDATLTDIGQYVAHQTSLANDLWK